VKRSAWTIAVVDRGKFGEQATMFAGYGRRFEVHQLNLACRAGSEICT
jgi:hypothetical protein